MPSDERTSAQLSFVIPVRDDADGLRRCLKSIRVSSQHARRVQVIVVDNGSRDDSATVARDAGAVVIAAPGDRVSAARNRGAAAAAGDLLAFVDADHEIAADWVEHASSLARADRRIGAFGAPYLSPTGASPVQRAYDLLRAHSSLRADVEWLGTGNLVVRRELFTRLGGFDPTLETCEDVDFCRRVRASGHRLLSDPALRSTHHGDPASLRAVFVGELWRGRDNLRVSFRRPRSIRSLFTLGSSIVMLAGSLAVGAGVVLLSTGSAGGAATATLGLAAVGLVMVARLARMLGNAGQSVSPSLAVAAIAVAAAYEAGRAFALVAPAAHGRRRRVGRKGQAA